MLQQRDVGGKRDASPLPLERVVAKSGTGEDKVQGPRLRAQELHRLSGDASVDQLRCHSRSCPRDCMTLRRHPTAVSWDHRTTIWRRESVTWSPPMRISRTAGQLLQAAQPFRGIRASRLRKLHSRAQKDLHNWASPRGRMLRHHTDFGVFTLQPAGRHLQHQRVATL